MSSLEGKMLEQFGTIVAALLSGGIGTHVFRGWMDKRKNGTSPATKEDIHDVRMDVKGVHERLDKRETVCAINGERIATLEERTRE